MTRKLTDQQQRRVKMQHEKRRKHSAAASTTLEETQLGAPQEGLLIMRHGRNVILENAAGEIFTCHFRQNLADIVPGDKVLWQTDNNKSGVVIAVQPRQNAFYKTLSHTPGKPLAANISCLVIVMAPEPLPSTELLDKYLVAAELECFNPLLLFNKIDLLSSSALSLSFMMQRYQKLGYDVMALSTLTGEGMASLQAKLAHNTSIFVGQSGVGKSSLINLLLPAEEVRVGAISDVTKFGRHTTSNARLYHLPGGGNIIDSPGVRDIELGDVSRLQIQQGFVECRPYMGLCKFRDCQHDHEPGCAIKQALEAGDIDHTRYHSFMKLLEGK